MNINSSSYYNQYYHSYENNNNDGISKPNLKRDFSVSEFFSNASVDSRCTTPLSEFSNSELEIDDLSDIDSVRQIPSTPLNNSSTAFTLPTIDENEENQFDALMDDPFIEIINASGPPLNLESSGSDPIEEYPTLIQDEPLPILENPLEEFLLNLTNKKTLTLSDGSHYEGEVNDQNQLQGEGLLTFPNGDFLRGTFVNNEFLFGTGKHTEADGSVYQGQYYENLCNGIGFWKKNPNDFETDYLHGEWISGQLIDGNVRITFSDGEYFIGEYSLGIYTGNIFYPDGSVQEGKWVTFEEKKSKIGENFD